MEVCYKYHDGNGRFYQIAFSANTGVSLSTNKTYTALLIHNQFVGYCEGQASGTFFRPTFELDEGHHFKILTNLNCWDLLTVMESDYVDDEDLIHICFGPEVVRVENGLTDVEDD